MTTHELKTWPQYFSQIMHRNRSFETRINDRDFKINDYLLLNEWDPETEEYTGRFIMRHVVYIFEGGFFGIPDNMVVMALNLV